MAPHQQLPAPPWSAYPVMAPGKPPASTLTNSPPPALPRALPASGTRQWPTNPRLAALLDVGLRCSTNPAAGPLDGRRAVDDVLPGDGRVGHRTLAGVAHRDRHGRPVDHRERRRTVDQ